DETVKGVTGNVVRLSQIGDNGCARVIRNDIQNVPRKDLCRTIFFGIIRILDLNYVASNVGPMVLQKSLDVLPVHGSSAVQAPHRTDRAKTAKVAEVDKIRAVLPKVPLHKDDLTVEDVQLVMQHSPTVFKLDPGPLLFKNERRLCKQ